MDYRVKYIYNGTRDKGVEIMDSYGDYESYTVVLKDYVEKDKLKKHKKNEEIKFANVEYKIGLNPKNQHGRELVKKDILHEDLKVYQQERGQIDENIILETKWERQTIPKFDYEEHPCRRIIGTELANFLNFDIERYIHGGYSVLWKHDIGNEKEVIIGLQKEKGHNLDDFFVRQEVSTDRVYPSNTDNETENVPFFIKMFGCKFINFEKWEYDSDEIENIKQLQKRVADFCEKVFFPSDESDKRTNFERYCDNVKNISRKELRDMIPKDWFTPSSLEQALAYECYAMIKGNVNFFRCENCGLYTAASDNRSRLCNRLKYDGTIYENNNHYEYRYICKEEKYIKNVKEKVSFDLIDRITEYEKKRLYNHIDEHPNIQYLQYELITEFENIILGNKQKFVNMVAEADNDEQKIKLANEYLQLIIDKINEAIKAILNSAMEDKYSFKRKRNRTIKSVDGDIFK